MKELRFYKEKTNEWYADIPDWTGLKAQLQMIDGADTLLDLMAEGKDEVTVEFSETEFDGAETLHLVNVNNGIKFMNINLLKNMDFGADYLILTYKGQIIDHNVWICNVTKYVFGHFPLVIYFKVK